MHQIGNFSTVDPVLIGHIRAHAAFAELTVAGHAVDHIDFFPGGQIAFIGQLNQGGGALLTLCPGQRLGFSCLHLFFVGFDLQVAGAQHMIMQHINHPEDDCKIKQIKPPWRQIVIQFLDPVIVMVQQFIFYLLFSH